MQDSVWNKITEKYGDGLSKERVSELCGILGGDIDMMIFRIRINRSFFEISDTEAMFADVKNMKADNDANQSDRPTTAERLSDGVATIARNLSVSAICSNNKRDRDRNVSTADQKKESGKPNPDTKNTKLAPSLKSDEDITDESADGQPQPTVKVDTDTTAIVHVEDKFDYISEDDDSVDDGKVAPDMKPAAKPSAELVSAAFPPRELSIPHDFKARHEKMNSKFHLNVNLRAPSVEAEDLSQPDGLDHNSRMSLMGRRGALASAVAQGKMIHDITELTSQGFPRDVATRAQYCYDYIDELGGYEFSISLDHDKKTFGMFCNSCNEELHIVQSCYICNIMKVMTIHSASECNGSCPCCGLSAATIHDSYKLDKYLIYQAQLCKRETAVPYDDYIDCMITYHHELDARPGSNYFFMSQSRLFDAHTAIFSKKSGKTQCENWYDTYEKIQKYVYRYKSITLEYKNIEVLFSLSTKEAKKLQIVLSKFITRYYVANKDGSYGKGYTGVMDTKGNNFTGLRYTKIHSIHVWLEQEQTKGMKKLTKMGFGSSKK